MQPKHEIEKSYETPDPWFYKSNPEDAKRKQYILHTLDLFGPYTKALDVGCGEAWITQHLRAPELYGFEISDNASQRFPFGVRRLYETGIEVIGKFDLVITSGTLYGHYDWSLFMDIIQKHSSGIVLTCNIAEWEHDCVRSLPGKELLVMEFPYQQWTQRMRIHDVRK